MRIERSGELVRENELQKGNERLDQRYPFGRR